MGGWLGAPPRARRREKWNPAFGKFLADEYGLKAEASCDVGTTLAWAERRVKLHIQGACDGDRIVVETGWTWDDAAAVSPAAKPTDDDPEPAPPPPRPPARPPGTSPPRSSRTSWRSATTIG